MFDVNQFLQTTYDQSPSTEYLNPPDGSEAVGICMEVAGRAGTIGKEGPNYGKPYLAVDLMIEFTDPAITSAVKRDKWTGKYGMMLDLNAAGNVDLSEGMNVKLGRALTAVGWKPGQPWSFQLFKGNALRCKLKHRSDDSGRVYCEVSEVTRVS